MKYRFSIDNIDCANCASKVENALVKSQLFQEITVNFMLKQIQVITDETDEDKLLGMVTEIAVKVEPDVIIKKYVPQASTRRKPTRASAKVRATEAKHTHTGEGCCGTHSEGHDYDHKHTEHEACGCDTHSHVEHESCGCGSHNHDHSEVDSGHGHKESEGCACCNVDMSFKKKPESHTHDDKKSQKIVLGRIIGALLLMILGSVTKVDWVYIIAYVIIGYDVLFKAAKNIARGKIFDENFLMTIATIAAFLIKEYPEAAAVMIFYQIGEFLQHKAVSYSRAAIVDLMDIRPDFARLLVEGEEEVIDPSEIQIGEMIRVRPGEKIPLDGIVRNGNGHIDTAMLTGEAVPVYVSEGTEVLSGCINRDGVLEIEVTKAFGDSTVSRILELMESASSKKSAAENFITKFAKWYTPTVVILAALTAVVPSIITGNWSYWIYNSIIFLVISCPCALVVSIPLGFFGGIGAASKKGVLIKGSNYLEKLNEIDTIVLDKTGTITKGQFGVTEIEPAEGISTGELTQYAVWAEGLSNHPIAKSIVQYGLELGISNKEVDQYEEIAGHGILAKVGEQTILAGNDKLMERYNVNYTPAKSVGTSIYVAVDNKYKGCIVVADMVKEDSEQAIRAFKAKGIKQVIMLTGDKKEVAEDIGKKVGVDTVYSELLPQDKVTQVEHILASGAKVAFVGDGINDAPVLARADVGISMGGIGSDAAVEASDIVLLNDDLSSIGEVLDVSKQTKRIVTQNIILALGTKAIVMVLGFMGIANMWLAIMADVGISLIAIINSVRILLKDREHVMNMLRGSK